MARTRPSHAPPSQPLCSQCRALPAAWLVPRFYDVRDKWYPRYKEPCHYFTYLTWAELEASASSSALCALVSREAETRVDLPCRMPDPPRPGVFFEAYGFLKLEVRCIEACKVARLNVALDETDVHRLPAHAQHLFTGQITSKQAGDGRNLRTIRRWLSLCISSHENCSRWASSRELGHRHLPTRVLDVGKAGDDLVRLHISSGGDTSDYITLSYCWGLSGNPIVTTADNLAMHIQDGIRVSALPATLRQAVELTRLLGIKYIWIDALCIIQHDVEDWTRESALMSSVYSQSLLTIAAAGAVDVKEGLFLKRSERHGSSVQLPWPGGQIDDGAGPLMLHITPSFRLFQVEIPQTPLSSRGWTFQERALSARVLHFTNEMCYWECKQSHIGEDDAHGRYSVLDEFYHLHGLLLPPSVEGSRKASCTRSGPGWSKNIVAVS
ncbi:HET-domain-containing protein [Coniochaeta sp. PMI_546]|nr:HET-domain-containing protein [Coniochaeta sp. PMI_546]